MSETNILGKDRMVKAIRDVSGASVTYAMAEKIYDELLAEMKGTLDANGRVRLHGIGTLVKRPLKARIATKPGTTEKIQVPARVKYALRPTKPMVTA